MSGRHEYPDPTPVEMPLGFKRPPTLQEEIQRIIRQQMSMQAEEAGFESFEEADDFEVDEDPDPLSPYEVTEMQEEAAYPKETLDGPKPAPGPSVEAEAPVTKGAVVPPTSNSTGAA